MFDTSKHVNARGFTTLPTLTVTLFLLNVYDSAYFHRGTPIIS